MRGQKPQQGCSKMRLLWSLAAALGPTCLRLSSSWDDWDTHAGEAILVHPFPFLWQECKVEEQPERHIVLSSFENTLRCACCFRASVHVVQHIHSLRQEVVENHKVFERFDVRRHGIDESCWSVQSYRPALHFDQHSFSVQ